MIVIDASITMAWAFADESTAEAEAVLDQVVQESAIVPSIWAMEVANVLTVAERRHRISAEESAHFIGTLQRLNIRVAPAVGLTELVKLLDLTREHGLSSYDASYLDLARRMNLPLATLDKRLRASATSAGVRLIN